MGKIFWLMIIIAVVVSCNEKSSDAGDYDSETDSDVADYDEAAGDSDSEEAGDDDQWYNAPVVKCEKDSDCPENEFCDPYRECQCKRAEDYVIRYKGKCIHGSEGNKFFCNGNSHAFNVRHDVPRKGNTAYTEKIEDVTCKCNMGYFGLNCERKHEAYPDIFPVGADYFLPEPNCKKDEDCDEGMKCSEAGYCYCDGEVVFDDPVLLNAVKEAVGKSDFNGKDLINVTKMTLIQVQHLNNMKCLPNLRAVEIAQPYSSMEITELAECENLQFLRIFENPAFDFSPLLKLKKLLFLSLDLTKDSYKFLNDIDAANHLESVGLYFSKGDYPEDFSFIKRFKKMRNMRLFYGQNATLYENCPFDFSNFADSPNLQYLLVYAGRCEIKNINELSKIKELRELFIGNLTTDLKKTRHLNLSDFPVLPNVTTLWIDSTVFDGNLIDHFPALTNLHLYGYGIDIENLEFLSGMNNMKLLYLSENYTDKIPFDEKRYDPIGKMPNLTELDIRNSGSRSYSWFSGLKHIALAGLPDENRYYEYVRDYNENGSDGTDQYSNLLYLSTYIDNTYHIDNVKGFRENCDKNGAICNSSFWKNYINGNDFFPPALSLCSNPLDKYDDDVQYLLEKGVGLNIGDDSQSCEVLSPEDSGYMKLLHPAERIRKKMNFLMDEEDGSSEKWISK